MIKAMVVGSVNASTIVEPNAGIEVRANRSARLVCDYTYVGCRNESLSYASNQAVVIYWKLAVIAIEDGTQQPSY